MSISSSEQNAAAVKTFIEEELLSGRQAKLDNNTNLIEAGVIDSLTLLRLVTFLEERFQIQVQDEEIVPENFHTMAAIQNFISQRQGANKPQGN